MDPANRFPDAARGPRWGWLENAFVLIQLLSTALFFLPGVQSVRLFIRIVPYVSSWALLVRHLATPQRKGLPPGGWLLFSALVLLVLNLFHPLTNQRAGLAQIGLQLSIAAPMFWAHKVMSDRKSLERVIHLFFLASGASALVGVLQVYYPDMFLPPELNQQALAVNPRYFEMLKYVGADGELILRPPGLSDMPGGASIAGALAGFLGVAFGSQAGQQSDRRLFYYGTACVGMLALYLTQVRSVLMMTVVALGAMCFLLARIGRVRQSILMGLVSGVLVVGAFAWAVTIGGDSVQDRFLNLTDDSPLESYQKSRGYFLAHTFNELLTEYPLGAGLGRWGVMSLYFGTEGDSPALHAEIQLTGWLYDGGFLLWILYGGAIAQAIFFAYRQGLHCPDPELRYLAGLVCCMDLFFVGQSLAGPVFNNQLGTQFWLLNAALYGATSLGRLPGSGAPHFPKPAARLVRTPARIAERGQNSVAGE